ncbi:LOW QUALITY PROTEIN: hypothetical protein QYF61_021976, partial [Mycteria americana]
MSGVLCPFQYKKHVDIVEQSKGHKDDEETGASVLQGEAKGAGTVQPGEEKAQRDPISPLKGGCKEEGSSDKRQWAQSETQEIPLKHRKKKITVRVVKQWNGFLRDVAESPSMEILKTHLDTLKEQPVELLTLLPPPSNA